MQGYFVSSFRLEERAPARVETALDEGTIGGNSDHRSSVIDHWKGQE